MIKLYGASWCKPCNQTKEIFDSNDVQYEYLDVDDEDVQKVLEEKNISSIPYIEIVNNGEIVHTRTGSVNNVDSLNKLLKYDGDK